MATLPLCKLLCTPKVFHHKVTFNGIIIKMIDACKRRLMIIAVEASGVWC